MALKDIFLVVAVMITFSFSLTTLNEKRSTARNVALIEVTFYFCLPVEAVGVRKSQITARIFK